MHTTYSIVSCLLGIVSHIRYCHTIFQPKSFVWSIAGRNTTFFDLLFCKGQIQVKFNGFLLLTFLHVDPPVLQRQLGTAFYPRLG